QRTGLVGRAAAEPPYPATDLHEIAVGQNGCDVAANRLRHDGPGDLHDEGAGVVIFRSDDIDLLQAIGKLPLPLISLPLGVGPSPGPLLLRAGARLVRLDERAHL